MSYLFFSSILLLATLAPVFIHKDTSKPRKLVYVNRAIIAMSIIFAVSCFLMMYSNAVYDSLPVACPGGMQRPTSLDPFGHEGKCLELSNEQDKVEMINTIDIIGVAGEILSILLITLLSLMGLVMEIVDKRKRGQGLIGALWSTSFLTLSLLITVCVIAILFM